MRTLYPAFHLLVLLAPLCAVAMFHQRVPRPQHLPHMPQHLFRPPPPPPPHQPPQRFHYQLRQPFFNNFNRFHSFNQHQGRRQRTQRPQTNNGGRRNNNQFRRPHKAHGPPRQQQQQRRQPWQQQQQQQQRPQEPQQQQHRQPQQPWQQRPKEPRQPHQPHQPHQPQKPRQPHQPQQQTQPHKVPMTSPEEPISFPTDAHLPGSPNAHGDHMGPGMDDPMGHLDAIDAEMAAAASSVAASCPSEPNFTLGSGKRLLVSSLRDSCPPMTWQRAVEFCTERGLQPYAFDRTKTRQEMEDMLTLLHLTPTPIPGLSYWTSGRVLEHSRPDVPHNLIEWPGERGHTERVPAGAGLWSRGTRDGEGTGQPDNFARRVLGRDEDEDCVVVQRLGGDLAGLHDTLCGQEHPAVCEEKTEVDAAFLRGMRIPVEPIMMP